MSEANMREALVVAGRQMVASGLSHGTSGNLSQRTASGFLITPSAILYGFMTPEEIIPMSAEGVPGSSAASPSTEWRMHRDIYAARLDVSAVVHAHPPHATALACLRRELPAAHYMVAVAGGNSVRCAEYATFGTAELSTNTLAALTGRDACLLANHGMVALGRDLPAALAMALEVEQLAQIYLLSLAAGAPVVLGEAEMDRVVQRFRSYRK